MEMLPLVLVLFVASMALNGWFVWQMFKAHGEKHDRIESMWIDCHSNLADRVEDLEKTMKWKGE